MDPEPATEDIDEESKHMINFYLIRQLAYGVCIKLSLI